MSDSNLPPAGVSAAEPPFPPLAVGWYATFILAMLYWLSILDRFIISLLVEPIKKDLGITDFQFSLLHGLAFAVTFSLFGLLAGALADRFSRRWVIYAGVTVWSLATAACGMAANFVQLMIARVGVGMGEAALNPSANSMLADLFPRDKLTTALAVYAFGSVVGSGCAYLFGGLIVEFVSQSETMVLPVLGEMASWQAVFMIVGLPGALASLLIFTVPEPVRRGTVVARQGWLFILTTYRDLCTYIKTQSRFFGAHYAAFGLASAIVTGTGSWFPAHMGRTFGWSSAEIGITLGIIMATTGIVGQLLCGRVVDTLYKKGYRDAQFRWFAGCLLVATPLGVIGLTSATPWVFVTCIVGFQIFSSSVAACAMSSLNLATPGSLRASGVAFYAATAGLLGAASGPMLIAGIGDTFYPTARGIGFSMATLIAICFPLAAFILLKGLKAMREAVTAIEQ